MPFAFLRYTVALPLIVAPAIAEASVVRVVVHGARAHDGDIQAALCTRQEFGQFRCARTARSDVRDGVASLDFEAPPGRYAVAVFHDIYQDGRIHKSILGIPRQGVGFSRNPLLIGAPSFGRASFDVPAAGTAVSIDLRFEPGA